MSSRTVFISYTNTDEKWALLIGKALEEMGHTVIAMYKGFPGDYRGRIMESFDKCDDIILVFSPTYEKSGECEYERSVAIRREYNDKSGTVHSVKVDPYQMADRFAVLTFIDLSLYPFESQEAITCFKNEITKRWGSIRKKPPTYHNLPLRLPNFTGRNDEIEKLHSDLFSGKTETRIQVLAGLAGVGKTKLSLEYAYRYMDQYRLIWLFHAEDPTQLIQEITNLVQTLNLPDSQSENSDQHIRALKKHLDKRDKWLLIFDNAGGPNDVTNYLPSLMSGHVLITSRNLIWGSLACIHSLSKFTRDQSVTFLEKRLHRTNENPCLGIVADKLDHLPLALNIAAAFMDTNQMNCNEYRTILDETQDIIFSETVFEEDRSLLRVWGLSLDKIRNKSEPSSIILEYLCYLSPDEIPEEILFSVLLDIPELSSHVKQKMDYYRLLSLLYQYSFVTKNNEFNALNMHRLLQAGILYMVDQERKKQQVEKLVSILSSQFPMKSTDPETTDSRMWQKCRKILPHSIKVAEIARNLNVASEETTHLYAQAASFLRELGNFTEAGQYADTALSITDRSGKNDTPLHAVCLETKARIMRDIGKNQDAQDLILHAITIEEKYQKQIGLGGPPEELESVPAHLAVCYDGYGRILSNLGKNQESLDFYNKALSIDLEIYGKGHPKIAIRKNNIGCAYGRLGQQELHIKNLQEALAIDENFYSQQNEPNHPHIAIRLSNLALAYEENRNPDSTNDDRFNLACEYWTRSREINYSFYGLSSPHTLMSLLGLAGHFRLRKDFEKALELNNEAITITEGSDPGGYYHALSYLYRANTYVAMEKFSEAVTDYENGAAMMSDSRNSDGSDYSRILQNIAYSKFCLGDYPGAVINQEKSLDIEEKNARVSGKDYCLSLFYLGVYYLRSEDFEKAKKTFFRALPLIEKEYSANSQQYFDTVCCCIETKMKTNDTADLQDLIRKGQTLQKSLQNSLP